MLALLPMKGHSERVPGKNYRRLLGKPLFYYVADTLRESGFFTRLVIDTDSPEIEDLARDRYGDWAQIIQRPPELCGDLVPMNEIIRHDITVVGLEHDFLQTHSTNPFLTCGIIGSAVERYSQGKKAGLLDSLFAANGIRSRLYDKNLKPINHNPKKLARTQDLDVVFEENSNFYLFSGASFLRMNHRIGQAPAVFDMGRNSVEALDIDDLTDWQFAEAVLRARLAQLQP